MACITVPAYAKVNLTITVTGRRADGYHLIETVFQRISLCDRLTIAESGGEGLLLRSDFADVPPENNIITRAYKALKREAPSLGGLSVTLEKCIPTQAGLGGGSADCAAFLCAVNRLCDLHLPGERLMQIGAELGADVPACMLPGASLGRGIGEQLTPIRSRLPLWFVIIKPPCAFSTAEMYHRMDAPGYVPERRFTAKAAMRALEQGRLDTLCQSLYNEFEAVAASPTIAEIKESLQSTGAAGSLMTGSGSCVFGLFADRASAERAAALLPHMGQVYVCRSQNEECTE